MLAVPLRGQRYCPAVAQVLVGSLFYDCASGKIDGLVGHPGCDTDDALPLYAITPAGGSAPIPEGAGVHRWLSPRLSKPAAQVQFKTF
jgi:hypothetical protein